MDIKKIGDLIKTQDNRITDQPIFVVEKSVMIITDPDYGYDAEEWINTESGDYEQADDVHSIVLNEMESKGDDIGEWKKFYLKEVWEFVTACFTEQGCKDYLESNGHNIGKSRIYAYGSYRNKEYQAVRNYLISISKIENENG